MRMNMTFKNKIKNKNKNGEKGFSLLEMLVTLSIFLVVLMGVYTMVGHFGDTTRTENSRLRMQQESRFLTSNFAAELKNAGSVLTVTNTGSFLSPETPYFNGIYPLNNTNFPDGIIVASGDPEAVTTLTAPHSFESNGLTIQVKSTEVPVYYDEPADDSTVSMNPSPWAAGDMGIVIGPEGYYVFSVVTVTATTITTRTEPVYYSGLLSTTHYHDTSAVPGNTVIYPGAEGSEPKSPVIRLASFAIYLFKEIPHPVYPDRKVRQLIRVGDARGSADVLNSGSIISENIWDMQITYTAYEDFASADPTTPIDPAHYYFAGGTSSYNQYNLLADLRGKLLKQLDISVVTLTDEYGGRGNIVNHVPAIGDQAAQDLTMGKYSYKILSLEIQPRNYNIQL